MAEPSKKPSYLIWILVVAGIVILAIAIGFYMVYRKIGMTELRAAERKDVDNLKATIVTLQNDIRNRDEKISKQTEEIAALNTRLIQMELQLRDVKKSQKQMQSVVTQSSESRTLKPKKSVSHENSNGSILDMNN